MSTINRVVLLGNVGTVEVKELQTGNKIVEVSLATSDGYKKNEEWIERTEWHRCIFAIPSLAERAATIGKGDKIYVEGSINTQQWTTKEGEKREKREISCTMFKTFSKGSQDKGSKPVNKPSKAPASDFGNDDMPF